MISSVSMSREMNRMIAAFTNRVNSNTAFDKAVQSSESASVFTSRDKPRLGTITKDNYPGKWDLLDIDFEEQLGFTYSKAKSNPTDLEVNWSVTSLPAASITTGVPVTVTVLLSETLVPSALAVRPLTV